MSEDFYEKLKMLVAKGRDVIDSLSDLSPFVNQMNLGIDLSSDMDKCKLARVADFVGFMPSTLRDPLQMSDGVAYLHYTVGQDKTEYFITHRDFDTEQRHCFGLILQIGSYPRFDFIDLHELVRSGAELDWNWGPVPVEDILSKLRGEQE